MLKFRKWVKTVFWCGLVVILSAFLTTLSLLERRTTPSWEEIQAHNNISNDHPQNYQRAIYKSRQSAMQIRSASINVFAGVSTTTGTYFTAKGNYYVITVEHGILGPCLLISVMHGDDSYGCTAYVQVDASHDYIIMEIEGPIKNRKPIRIPEDLPHGSEWKSSYSILNNIVYTGYPNVVGPLTLKGDVVGYTDNELLYIFSHAYGGASGSGIFTSEGKYIGYVVAIDVGATSWGAVILENIVIVAPAFNVDWSTVLN
jgi:hypothetical protein